MEGMTALVMQLTMMFMAAGPERALPRLSVGDSLPALSGQFLSGKAAELPKAASGRVALLALGFSYDSRIEVEAWTKRFRAQFGADPRVTFYEVPMIGGMARLGRWFIDSGMRRGTPQADYEHVITVYGGVDAWKERVGYKDSKAAYLILLDQTGKAVWFSSGAVEDKAYTALSAETNRLLSGSDR